LQALHSPPPRGHPQYHFLNILLQIADTGFR
jgi:hypothetical protein